MIENDVNCAALDEIDEIAFIVIGFSLFKGGIIALIILLIIKIFKGA